MHYLIVDGEMSGTGIKSSVTGASLEPPALGLSETLRRDLAAWVEEYGTVHQAGFTPSHVERLDRAGLDIAMRIKSELPVSKIQYRSAATLTTTGVPFL